MRKWAVTLLILTILSGFYLVAFYSGYRPSVDNYSSSFFNYIKSASWQIKQFLENNGFETSAKTADRGQILLAIFAGSITILAIVFSVSHFVITQVSDNYSPYFIDTYEKSNIYRLTFWVIIVVILVSLIAAIFDSEDGKLFKATILLFLFGLILLIQHFRFTLLLLNPKGVLKVLEKDVEHNIKKGDTEKIKSNLDSMGDIAVKSLIRKEEDITLRYIDGFYRVFEKYLPLLNKVKQKVFEKLRPRDFVGWEQDILSYSVFSNLERVFLQALYNRERRVTEHIASKLFKLALTILEKGDDVLFSQLIDTKIVEGAAYIRFFRNAMEHRDTSRIVLVRNIFNVLQYHLYHKEIELNHSQVTQLIDYHLFRVNKLIVDYDDFELFLDELDWASLAIPSLDLHPIRSLNEMIDDIHGLLSDFSELRTNEMIERINEWPEHEPLKNFNAEELRQSLYILKKQLQEHITSHEGQKRIEETFEGLEKYLRDYETYARLFRTFFLLGAYIMFLRNQNKEFNHVKYIKELWGHTSPEDADAHHLNKTPVCFDPLWLIYLITYMGENNSHWYFKLRHKFQGYHGIRDYVYQYWILLLGKWDGDLKIPDEKTIEDWKNSGQEFKLEFWFELCMDFLICHKEDIQKNFEKILENRLYEGIYEEEEMRELKNKFEDLVKRMGKALDAIQGAQR